MSRIKLIGRKTDFRGKTLWEIVGNLRNFGIGRLVTRNMFQRYPEPCYFRILKVQAVDSPTEEYQDRKVRVLVESTWRGITQPKPIEIYSTSYKADYKLVPKEEEFIYLNNRNKVEKKIVQSKIDFPPLLCEYIRDETGEEKPLMKVHFKNNRNKQARLALDEEKPNIKITMGLGKPASRNLYKDIEL